MNALTARTTTGSLLVGIVLLAACGGDNGSAAVVHRDSAGIAITESFAPVWGDSAHWSVDPEPILDLTEAGDGPDYEFFNVTDAARRADGTIVVADDGEDEIRLFAADGSYRRTLGRQGDGPGEFRRLTQVMALHGDSIWAYDYWQKRITVLGPDGGWRVETLEGAYRPRPLFALAAGGYVGLSREIGEAYDEPGVIRKPYHVVKVARDGVSGDTLTTLKGNESLNFELGIAGVFWGQQSHLAVHGDRVVAGSTDDLSYREWTPDGDLDRIVRVVGYDLTLTDADEQALIDAIMPDPAEASRPLRLIVDGQPDRDRRPAFSAMRVDALGHVWLGQFQGFHEKDEPHDWFIFDPAGAWLGTVTLPPRFEPFRIGEDWILGKRPDELEVEHVQLLRLDRGPSA